MEDENGIELSLGLSCGSSSAKLKLRNGSSSDTRTDENDKGNKLVDNFKSFLHTGIQNPDSGHGSERTDSPITHDNFFNNLSRATVEAEEDKSCQRESAGKRKMLFDELNHPKKQEKEAHGSSDKNSQMGVLNSTKTSHISVNTEDGSTAENEDVAESEVEGSTSRLVSQHEEGAKRYAAIFGSSEVPKEVRGYTDSNVVNLQGPLNMMNVPYSLPVKESNSVGAPSSSSYPLPGIVQLTRPSNGEKSGTQHGNSGNLTFGYSPVQLPMLDKEHTWSLGSNPQPATYDGKGAGGATLNPDGNYDVLKISQAATQACPLTSTEARIYDGRVLEFAKVDGKHHTPEEGFSSQKENGVKGNHKISTEGLGIRPGIAADVKFGGCGSLPNLPWVSTTGPGPNGKTISGVPYRFSTNQIKIVCACHGTHMTPEEFIQHACEENVGPDGGSALPSVPSNNPAASAQS